MAIMAGKHEKANSCGFRTSIGGQALIEGILMRGPKKQAIVCRTEEGLTEKVEELHLLREKYPFFGWPLVRGCVTFIDSMVKGMQALMYSASRRSRTRSTSGSRSTSPPRRPRSSSSMWRWCSASR